MFTQTTSPTVITKELLLDLVVKQGPQGEAGKYFLEDGVRLEEITEIRIEHYNILVMSHLWIMTNLTKLSLCNNIIENIENLNELVNLKELDLSFNRIEIIENLENLVNLEMLSLYSNNIKELKGLDSLNKLQIFSIGKNRLSDWDHVLYLRKFKLLRSLNTSGNPCAEENEYFNYVIAFIPQLIYLRYKMISEEERSIAMEKYQREILSIQDAESTENEKLEAERRLEEHNTILHNAYVEYLDEDYLFEEMFKNDKEGNMFLDINKEIEDVHENYKKIFCKICHEMVAFGLSEEEKRSNEFKLFNDTIEEEKTKVTVQAREIVNAAIKKKVTFFHDITELLNALIEEKVENNYDNVFEEALKSTENIINVIVDDWNKLMKYEVTFHQQVLDTLETFKVNMTDMVNNFVESSRGSFSQLRNAEVEYNSNLNKLVSAFISNFGDDIKMPLYLTELCGDKDTMINSLSATHDVHLQVINAREDVLLNRIKTWFSDLLEKLLQDETTRYKSRILEISQILGFTDPGFESLRHHANVSHIFTEIFDLFNDNQFVFWNEKLK